MTRLYNSSLQCSPYLWLSPPPFQTFPTNLTDEWDPFGLFNVAESQGQTRTFFCSLISHSTVRLANYPPSDGWSSSDGWALGPNRLVPCRRRERTRFSLIFLFYRSFFLSAFTSTNLNLMRMLESALPLAILNVDHSNVVCKLTLLRSFVHQTSSECDHQRLFQSLSPSVCLFNDFIIIINQPTNQPIIIYY